MCVIKSIVGVFVRVRVVSFWVSVGVWQSEFFVC
jgi:hypothetical protein